MSHASDCPGVSDWQRLVSGQVSDAEAEALEDHLRGCTACLQIVKGLPPTDPLVLALKQASRTDLPGEEGRMARLLERVKALASPGDVPAPTPAAGALPAGGEHGSEGAAAEVRALLSPAQGPGEIGRLGGYRILKVLGVGGMGVVFLADDPALQRQVAVKTLKPLLLASGSARQRFLSEARAAAAIEHEHVIPILQVGEDRGLPFLVMPLLKGESLEARLRREGKLPPAEVLRIGREVAEGLAAAHERGLIHRDVKPANVWLETPPGDPGASSPRYGTKLLDFGLARAAGSASLTQFGAVMGTPAYMSPEQAMGAAVDARSDLFSLGCVLYQAGTGEPPFQGSDIDAILLAVMNHQPPAPSAVNPEVPPALSDLVLRLLAKRADDRPATAREVAAALASIEAGAVGRTRAPPRTRPVRPWRRWWMAACLLGLLAVLGLAAVAARLLSPPGTLAPPLKGSIDVLIWEKNNPARQDLHLGDPHALPLKPGDGIAIEAELNRPAYVYVLWIDTDGQVEPVYPWTPGHWEPRPSEERPVPRLRRPEALDEYYPIKQGTPGMHTLVLLARETPLPAEVDLDGELGKLPRQKEQDIRATVWFENGMIVQNEAGRRAISFDAGKRNDAVLQTQDRIRTQLLRRHFTYVRAVSFADQGK